MPDTLVAAYFYNQAEGRKSVYVNDRYGSGTRDQHGDVFCSEYNTSQSYTHPWEECQGISQSFAYNYEDNDESLGPPARLIHRFIDIVSRNGNLAIIGGPDTSGKYPENVVRRLRALGAWLKVNGEAIYATRVLPPYQEGPVSYTRSKDGRIAYAICKQWPGRKLVLKGVRADENATITMLGVPEPMVWQPNEQGLTLTIPDSMQDEKSRPCAHAWVIRIPMQPGAVLSRKDFSSPVTITSWGVCDRVVFTLDGSEPNPSSAVYTGPLSLPPGATTVLKAVCVRAGKLAGRITTGEFLTNGLLPPKPDVYLDTLDPLEFKTGWQAAAVKTWRNVNCHGRQLRVRGETFARGVGMHANGQAVFPVTNSVRRWVCRVGIDDAAAGRGSVVVKCLLDNKLLCQTSLLTGKDGLWNMEAPLPPLADNSTLKIIVEDNGDGIDGDNVDLVDAGFVSQP